MDLGLIPAFAEEGIFHVVVETPRGSALKLKYEPRWNAMSISRPLPFGVIYPFDWGFVPSTMAPDGDPLDAMLLWDVASFPGVVVKCRAIGVLNVEQNRVNNDPSARVRNDRVMCIPLEARREHTMASADALPPRVRRELEQFALTATALEGKDVRVLGWGDETEALARIHEHAIGRDIP